MRLLYCVFFVVLLFLIVNCDDDDYDERLAEYKRRGKVEQKLQVGTLRRAENCKIRSRKGDTLYVNHVGELEDGSVFDNTYHTKEPFYFVLGQGEAIKGFDLGLQDMCETEKRRLVIPPDLGYGDKGAGTLVPPHATVIFEVELLKIERKQEL